MEYFDRNVLVLLFNYRSECFFHQWWGPTEPQRSVCVQLRGCQGRRPCYRCLIADLQRAVSECSEEEKEEEEENVEK